MRQVLATVALVLLIRLPFLNQPIQGDDVYYLAGAQHSQIDPAHPSHARYIFLGDEVDMRGHPHPPLNAWILGAILAAVQDVREAPFHGAYILFSLIAALAMLSLARRFVPGGPLWAVALFLATPAFVVNGNSLESDLPFLAFWMAGIALFIRSADRQSVRLLFGSILCLALAALAAYQSVVVVAILGLYLWEHKRTWKPGWAAVVTPLLVLGLWQAFERLSTGALPAEVLAGHFQTYNLQSVSAKLKNAAALTGHLGWVVFPPLAIAAFRRWWIPASIAAAAGAFIDPHPLFWASFGVGALVIVWCIEHSRDFLARWVLIFFAAALVLFFAGSARYLLPLAAPVAMLAVLKAPKKLLAPALACQLAFSLMLSWVSYQHWDG
ncbi:MAG: glycosyltransferase family 39 protein, partial [Bryobacteraceae bacterium]|nr:glycosyltransferase family 39 protein [Bryobacteraceae bacterium]